MSLEWNLKQNFYIYLITQLCFLKQFKYSLLPWNKKEKTAVDEKAFGWVNKKKIVLLC